MYDARGIPYFSTQARSVSATPQVVSSDVNVARLVVVASSTMWIGQPRGPRASSQSSKLPSICTNSPKCARRSRRCRYGFRFRARDHSPSSSIQRRKVSASTATPWSSLRCSAANVGPNRSPGSPP
jgi:hypothetical protein